MFAKYITRLKLRRIVKRLQRQRALMKQELESRSENMSGRKDASAHDIEYVTRIYGGGMEEGKWL